MLLLTYYDTTFKHKTRKRLRKIDRYTSDIYLLHINVMIQTIPFK